MNEKLAVLHIDDDPEAARLSSRLLDEPGPPPRAFRVERADGLEAGLRALGRGETDAVLFGLRAAGRLGPDGLKAVRAGAPRTPVVALVEPGEDALGLEAVRLGAQDYLMRDRLSAAALKRALACAVERQPKDDLVDRVSHQMRTPLTVITAAVASLEEGLAGALTPKQAELARMAAANSRRLLRIVDGLLDLSRLESGAARVDLRRLDAAGLIRQTLRELRLLPSRTSVRIEEELEDDLPAVNADPELFTQTLTNLVSNALRFARGRVVVRARAEESPLAGQPPGVEFSVLDDGPGVPESGLSGLFGKFVQIQRQAAADGYKGTGLGLALCAEMVRRQGGRIWAEAAPGEGGRFHFLLPRHVAPEASRPRERRHGRRAAPETA